MKVSISSDTLQYISHLSSSIANKVNTMPILANCLLRAEDGKLSIIASDLSVNFMTSADAQVSMEGEVCVDAKVWSGIVKQLPETEVRLNLNADNKLEVSCGNSFFRVNGTSAEEYPPLNGLEIDDAAQIKSSVFKDMLDKVHFAVSTDESRASLQGVYLESGVRDTGEPTLKTVATDGHRLSLVEREIQGSLLDVEEGVIIPQKGVSEIRKSLEDSGGNIEIAVKNKFLTLKGEFGVLGIRVLDKEFPKYKNLIPKKFQCEFKTSVDDFSKALKRVSFLCWDKPKTVKLTLHDDYLLINSSWSVQGNASETIDVIVDGENPPVGISSTYYLDCLGASKEKGEVIVKLNGDMGATLICFDSDPDYLNVVMPMRFE